MKKNQNYKKTIIKVIQEKSFTLLLGLIIFLALGASLFKFLTTSSKNTNISPQPAIKIAEQKSTTNSPSLTPIVTPVAKEIKQEIKQQDSKKTYKVKPGDFLWKIAEDVYGSGYNAYDIAQANNITSPSYIYKDQELIIPSVNPKTPTKGIITGNAASTGQANLNAAVNDRYVVRNGDSLWKIAQYVYGDGYAWVKIAKANNILKTPDVIHVGNSLIIPRG